MTLEEKINTAKWYPTYYGPIEHQTSKRCFGFSITSLGEFFERYSDRSVDHQSIHSSVIQRYVLLLSLIRDTDPADRLASPSEIVREYGKWLENFKTIPLALRLTDPRKWVRDLK